MARPAGYSSDESYSEDEGLTLGNTKTQFKQTVPQNVKNEDEEIGDKFILAVIDNDIDVVKELIDDKKLIYKSSIHGNWTALMHASSEGYVEMVELLLKNNANPNDHYQLLTPLHCVCSSKVMDEMVLVTCSTLLIDQGALINALDWYGNTPLTHAVRNNREKLVLKLISQGCIVDSEDSDGWTPIFFAVDKGYANLVQILKDAGASIKKLDHKGRTLYDLAASKFFKEITEMVSIRKSKLADTDDEMDKFKNDRRLSNYQCVLAELPDKRKGRFNGFPTDAAQWLYGIGMGNQMKKVIDKGIHLGELLTMDDRQLKEVGVEFSFTRKKILGCAQKFHKRKWSKNCFANVKDYNDLISVAQFLCNALRQLHIVSTSTYFWKKNNGRKACDMEFIDQGLHYTKFLHYEFDNILKILDEIEEEDKMEPSDLIVSKKKESSSWINQETIFISTIFLGLLFKIGRECYPSVKMSIFKFPLI